MRKPLLLLLVLSLVFGLCGCMHQHTWDEATCTEPKTCSECGETEGDPLGHSWVEATYHAPITCSVCGETDGEPKMSIFEQFGFPVSDKLSNFSCKGVLAIDDPDSPSVTEITNVNYNFKTYTIQPSSRSGYKMVKIIFDMNMETPPHVNSLCSIGNLYDYYTGHEFLGKSTNGDEAIELFDSVTVDGNKYTIYYTQEVVWAEEWVETNNNTFQGKGTVTYQIDIPDEYDGLLLRFTDIEEWVPYEENNEFESEQLERTDSNGYNFRVGNS